MPLDPERAHLLARRNAAAVAAEPHLAELRRRLLACGGDEAVLQTRDPDSPALVARGEPRGVRGVQARRTQLAGPQSDCHRNAVTHFLRDPRRRRIMTGYYLIARDPVWRQHSWVEEEAEGGCPPKLDTLFADLLALERCTDADYDRATDAIASGAKTEAELMLEWAPMGLEIGTVVKIKNLKSRPELNGCEATVIDFRIANKRYGLQLSGGEGEKITVKPDNIQEVGGVDDVSAFRLGKPSVDCVSAAPSAAAEPAPAQTSGSALNLTLRAAGYSSAADGKGGLPEGVDSNRAALSRALASSMKASLVGGDASTLELQQRIDTHQRKADLERIKEQLKADAKDF
jgi:hypothetical protein